MEMLLAKAEAAGARGEVPVAAAVIGPDGAVIASETNAVERLGDPSAHAEMLVLREATRRLGRARLADCILVVTLEPCAMCAGAAVHFRIGRIVFGAYDAKGGAVEHGPRLFERSDCLHRPVTTGGVRETCSASLLRRFFQARRAREPYEDDEAFIPPQTQ